MPTIFQTSANQALRRVRQIQRVLLDGHMRWHSSNIKQDGYINIGDVSIKVKTPKRPELVPRKYVPSDIPQSTLKHLRWVMQKDVLGQDVFLLGPPGPLRRTIAMMYLELTQREAEYISLSRDTTETDLKQRREIRSGTAYYIDQCAVNAAIQGRVLVLEGIEKAERNVLPVLNNLLENREMQLDDGRFLMAAHRYDKLLQDHTVEELNAWKLVRVDESFRVIALGLPVPRYQGNPLDPPLRSRFQARDVSPAPFKEQLELLQEVGNNIPQERLSQLLSFASTMLTTESTSLGLPDFPIYSLQALVKIMNQVPNVPTADLITRLYPYETILGKEGKTAVTDILKKFELDHSPSRGIRDHIADIQIEGAEGLVSVVCAGQHHHIQVPVGCKQTIDTSEFVETDYHNELLQNMMLSHSVKDFCIIGPKGSGKSAVVKTFADRLNYEIEPIMLYQDMTSRDLLQQRSTQTSGDTYWRPSPLITAAVEGKLAVLDGIHRINPGTVAVLHRLIHDRELTLFNGTRLLRHDKYDDIKDSEQLSDDDMTTRSILRIHPSFRIVGLAEPPKAGSSSGQWLNPELLSMFLYHPMRPLSTQEEQHVINKLIPDVPEIQTLLQLSHKLLSSTDATLQSIATSLSTRQMLRIARRRAAYPSESLYDAVHKACLSRFLPRLARTALEQALSNSDIEKPCIDSSIDQIQMSVTCEIKHEVLRIGKTEVNIHTPDNQMKVPDVLFYDNPQHLSVMESMLKDFLLGEHLLLVGNQGVGKNKIVDRFLYLLNRPREYLQLHRDTTVQTLTLQPTVENGVIIYEDSPLVRAVKLGHVLVVDEADKAPTHVTCILKTLVESGEMHLSDGRKIITHKQGQDQGQDVTSNMIVSHPDFRMIVLANRPGFPFLGNDFFGAMGDIFSCHAVDNPNIDSEMSMLKQYGPDVPEHILRKLVLAFGELRNMADQGLLSYPYSTREVVNMVKHLQQFPEEGISSVVRNVFDFDSYNKEMQDTIVKTLHKHGIPIGARPTNIDLAKVYDLPKPELVSHWHVSSPGTGTQNRTALFNCPVEEKPLNIKGPVRMPIESFPLDRHESRALRFSEEQSYWMIPMSENNVIADVAVTKAQAHSSQTDDIIHIAAAKPIALYTMNPHGQYINYMDLYDVFPTMSSTFKPRLKLAPLGASVYNSVVLHEEMTNMILTINTETGDLTRFDTSTLIETAIDKFTRRFQTSDSGQGYYKMCREMAHTPEGLLVFYKVNEQSLEVINMLEGRAHSISVPFNVASVHLVDLKKWLIQDAQTQRRYLLEKTSQLGEVPNYQLLPIEEDVLNDKVPIHGKIDMATTSRLDESTLKSALSQDVSSPNRIVTTRDVYAGILEGFPDLQNTSVYSIPREPLSEQSTNWKDPLRHLAVKPVTGNVEATVTSLPESGQIVRALSTWQVPKKVFPNEVKPMNLSGYLEVADLANHKLRYIPVPGPASSSPYNSWLLSITDVNMVMSSMSNDGLVTVDSGGCVRLWETSIGNLTRSLGQWRNMIGGDPGKLQVTYQRDSGKEATLPKHGKVDSKNDPHVGGDTWAGGTGGRSTAGLGGKGGPYRLDAGHDVHQLSDAEKEAVPEHIKRAAREMGQKAFKERLREINMSEYDADLYESYASNVRKQVQSLRVILDSLQAKGKERQWLKNQTYGDLDDSRLIEGLTGEKAIYKRRGEQEPEMGSPQQLPKKLKLVVDVSGSMYRFNGHDGRLDRQMESVVMAMEAFEGYENKFQYEVIGHSGEMYDVSFTQQNAAPKNNKDRLNVLKTMQAHSQFCISGDYTLEAIDNAVKMITKDEADEYFVIALSDANLSRYGIAPKRLAEVLTSDERVNSFVIFIGSLGHQAQAITKEMPSGRSFVCMDTKDLPQILQQIFTSTMLTSR